MRRPSTNLLSEQELRFVEERGLPFKRSADIVNVTEGGATIFTMKGAQLYGYACFYFKMPGRLNTLATWRACIDLANEINEVILARETDALKNALTSGGVTLQQRDSVIASLYGTPAESLLASERLARAQAAGPNVIPLTIRK
jgi:hypothetical protein